MKTQTVKITQREIRETLTLKIKFPRLFGVRLRLGAAAFRIAARIVGVAVKVEDASSDPVASLEERLPAILEESNRKIEARIVDGLRRNRYG